MYRKFEIPRKLIIVTDEVITAIPSEDNIDPKQIYAAIQIAEERFIKKAICNDLYYDFRDQKNKVVDSINSVYIQSLFPVDAEIEEGDIVNAIEFVTNPYYVDLWYEHLWKLCAEAVMYIASPTNFSRFTAQGEMHNNPMAPLEGQAAASVPLGDMKWKLDKMLMDRIDPLIAGMDEWLHDNQDRFPLLTCKKWYNARTNPTGISYKRKTAWVHDVYPLHKEKECYSCRDQL